MPINDARNDERFDGALEDCNRRMFSLMNRVSNLRAKITHVPPHN